MDIFFLNCPRCELSMKLDYLNQFMRCPICHLKIREIDDGEMDDV